MTKLSWDGQGEKRYETGVDHGVLYVPDNNGNYNSGVAWNGLTTVTETPAGAESNPQYADNIKYVDILSAETFGGTIEAFTYPKEFGVCDGTALVNGILVGQQARKSFGFAYRSRVGNDVSDQAAYKLHLIYGAKASPSERAYATVNDSPEPINFSWEFNTTPVSVGVVSGTDYGSTSLLTVDSSQVDATALSSLNDILFGTAGADPRLPLPAEVLALFASTATVVNLANYSNQPSYSTSTHQVTLPAVTGIQWRVNGVNKSAGAQPAMSVGQNSIVEAVTQNGYVLSQNSDRRWSFDY